MKAIVYAAKSTTDVRGSIPTQIADCRELAEAEGMAIVGEYSDEAASAYSGDRGPQLAAAKAAAEQIAIDEGTCALIIQHSDRLARGDGIQAAHLVEYSLWAIKSAVKLRSVQDPQTFADLLYAVVTGQRNHEDSKRKSLAVKAGHERRARSGKAHGGFRPFGYRYGEHGSGLVQVPVEALIVKRIFARYLAGAAMRQITFELREDRIPTIRGGEWHPPTVRNILTNPLYAGFVKAGEDLVQGEHEAIVEIGTWERSCDLREAKARTHGRGRPPSGRHLFRKGFLRCGECGEPMVPRTVENRRTAPRETYVCYGRLLKAEACSGGPLRRQEIDGAVYRYFEQVGLDVDATAEALQGERDRRLTETAALVDHAEGEVLRTEQKLERIRRDYAEGAIDAADWKEFRSELGTELDAARAERDRLVASRLEIERDTGLRDAEHSTLAYLADIRRAVVGEVRDAKGVEQVRAALMRLFEGFVVHRGIPGRVHLELVGEVWIEPIVRESVIEGWTEHAPVIRREPLAQATENVHNALTR